MLRLAAVHASLREGMGVWHKTTVLDAVDDFGERHTIGAVRIEILVVLDIEEHLQQTTPRRGLVVVNLSVDVRW